MNMVLSIHTKYVLNVKLTCVNSGDKSTLSMELRTLTCLCTLFQNLIVMERHKNGMYDPISTSMVKPSILI